MADWVFDVEHVGIAVVLLLALATGLTLPGPFARTLRRAARFGRRGGLAAASAGIAAGLLVMSISLIRAPAPIGHDEQSYLLAADTFARGRLTNPTHPLWTHFETFHVIHRPTYASKYPPAQGMMLALGQVLTGRPIAGVWLSAGLAVAAVCWMLQGWLPGRWALLGGGIAGLHVGIQIGWGQSFWGGHVAMIGGALLFGALPRLWRRAEAGPALLMAVGLAILANSRPYEGLVASVPVALALGVRFCGPQRPPLRLVLTRVALPVAVTLSTVAAGMAYYNLRVTGSALRMPYRVHEETYMVTPVFLWQSPRPEPDYRHEIMRRAYVDGPMSAFEYQQSLSGLTDYKGGRIVGYLLHFFLRMTLIIPLLALPWALRSRAVWFAVATLLVVLVGSVVCTWVLPHYVAAAVPLLILLVVEGVRRLRLLSFGGRRVGRSMVCGLGIVYMLIFILSIWHYATVPRTGIARYRPLLLARLERLPGRHLVVVRYGPRHVDHINDEWVYNSADIDGAKVVWAREMDPAADQRLFDYFRDRRIWLLLADDDPPRLLPYREMPQRSPPSVAEQPGVGHQAVDGYCSAFDSSSEPLCSAREGSP